MLQCSVTEQIDAVEVLKVNPIRYLFVHEFSLDTNVPPVVVIASAVGVIAGAITADLSAGLGYRAYFDSAWLGIYMKDLGVALLKALFFGGTIALISCSCGYYAKGGAKGVGEATNKACCVVICCNCYMGYDFCHSIFLLKR